MPMIVSLHSGSRSRRTRCPGPAAFRRTN
jgi:hypothetical protein